MKDNAIENIVPLPISRRQKPALARGKERFVLQGFTNRGGTESWRVSGSKRDGSRVRENFKERQSAECRRIELEAEFHAGHSETSMRATKMTHEQVQISEIAVIRMGEDWPRLLDAVSAWLKDGSRVASESPRIDEAVKKFKEWVDGTETLRARTKANLKLRVGMFGNGIGNLRVADIRPETIEDYLGKRNVSSATKDNDKRTVSRFFRWCIERPRRWATMNPCREVRVEQSGDKAAPAILSIDECKKLLKAAEAHRDGRLVPYVAVCLFGGLRPFEASRLKWGQVNLDDCEIRIEAAQSKVKRARVVTISPTLLRWLKASKDRGFFPENWRKDFDLVKRKAGFGGRTKVSEETEAGAKELKPWPEDVMRHTAISHHFRDGESYGRTAEWAGNSEAIIKAHYQGRVSSDDTEKFYALRPSRKAGR